MDRYPKGSHKLRDFRCGRNTRRAYDRQTQKRAKNLSGFCSQTIFRKPAATKLKGDENTTVGTQHAHKTGKRYTKQNLGKEANQMKPSKRPQQIEEGTPKISNHKKT